MKIYTRTGDKGSTSLLDGKRVLKDHQRIEAYGTIDELIAFTALVRDQITDEAKKSVLLQIMDDLMHIASILACENEDTLKKISPTRENQILFLENEIDKMEVGLNPLHSFLLPGGHPSISSCHIARTICRRAERVMIKLSGTAKVPENTAMYINRLSDYFFLLSRRLSADLKINEIIWKP